MGLELSATIESNALVNNRYIEIIPNDRADIIGKLPIPM